MPRDGQIVPTRTTALMPQLCPYAFGATAAFFSVINKRKTASTAVQEYKAPPVDAAMPIIHPHPAPTLPVFEEITSILRKIEIPDLSKTAVISRQHHLASTIRMYEHLKLLGAEVYATGKVYSYNPSVEATMTNMGVHVIPVVKPTRPGYYYEASIEGMQQVWRQVRENLKVIKRIILLSDGGDLLKTMPRYLKIYYSMAGVEQTRGGLYSIALQEELFPIIDVASSAAKKELESPLIAKAIVKKVIANLPELAVHKELVCGIIGNGCIGYALATHLLQHGYAIMFYDENEKAFDKLQNKSLIRTPSIKSLISGSDYIFGCTGRDVTENISPFIFEGKKVFVNCASEDREFRTALRQIKTDTPEYNSLDDITVKHVEGKMIFMYGGFPINFSPLPKVDTETGKPSIPQHADPSCLPAEEIDLTQSLLALGVTQSLLNSQKVLGKSHQQRQCLDPYGQRYIVTRWLQRNSAKKYREMLGNFQHIDWIIKNSGGTYVPNPHLRTCFETIPLHDVPANRSPVPT